MSPFTRFLTFIRFSHTVFALPFAVGAMVVAADGFPGWRIFGLILLCMVFARTAAMTFNRVADWEIDKRNPRTAGRHKLIGKSAAIATCLVSALLFIASAAFINRICLFLSPVALGLVFFYSLTKRFTHAAQFFLGLALSAAPVGAWLAVTGSFAWPPIILAAGVLCWVAGFDMIYATQDEEADRREGLRSMVVLLGVPGALRLAGLLHLLMLIGLIAFGLSAHLGKIYFGGLLPVPFLLLYEHRIARSLDVGLINKAFFETNALIGALFVGVTAADRLLR
ncbi:MAG: 4-hydroxybenzoate octaprenyltransferase [Verrucomicrobiota bacterium]|jgi:4-hydroxybenzoate polyprenyltransferase